MSKQLVGPRGLGRLALKGTILFPRSYLFDAFEISNREGITNLVQVHA